ncbi:MAG: hypothetical protein A2Y56_08125 [Candidatus Aminicenantes bacterium RBG_13_63_10]|nr:MAG: hypothetical protein A2Y56_08125 [Candidatus Aminicenantes bacterium RBG_13_63_10]
MAIDPELLEILACPVCKVSVTLTRDGAGLFCGKCLRLYPIVDDIPVMLVEEAVLVKKAKPAPPRTEIQSRRKAGAKAKPKPKAGRRPR